MYIFIVHIVAYANKHACMHTLCIGLRYITLRYITLHYITLHVKPDTRNLHNRFSGFSVQVDILACGRVIKSIFQNWRRKNAELGETGSISIRKLPFFQHPNDHPIRPLEIRWNFSAA